MAVSKQGVFHQGVTALYVFALLYVYISCIYLKEEIYLNMQAGLHNVVHTSNPLYLKGNSPNTSLLLCALDIWQMSGTCRCVVRMYSSNSMHRAAYKKSRHAGYIKCA
jgi:hypothetical protein